MGRAIKNRVTKLVWAILLLPVICTYADEVAPVTNNITSFKDLMNKGGWSMWVIVALSVAAVCLILFYMLSLRSGVLSPSSFILEAENIATEGDVEALAQLCNDNGSAAARIIGAAATQIKESRSIDYMVVRDALEDEGAREASVLWQRIQYLMDIGVIAPMVGLLGTVLGMLRSFGGFNAENAANKAMVLTEGVSQAMVTTAGGLVVGIASMLIYAMFRGRLTSLIATLESSCSGVLHRLMNNAGTEK